MPEPGTMANATHGGAAIARPMEPVHPAYVRVTHWINAVAIVAMIGSGWEIYNASPLFPFVFPKSITLGGWLAGALLWHFAAMWLWVANGLVYVILGVLSENSIRPDSRGELESAHHPMRCLRSSACLGCSWPTRSSRERGLRPRSFSCVINSTSA